MRFTFQTESNSDWYTVMRCLQKLGFQNTAEGLADAFTHLLAFENEDQLRDLHNFAGHASAIGLISRWEIERL